MSTFAVAGTSWPIRDATGTLCAIHERIDRPGGSKTFQWRLPDGRLSHGDIRVGDLPFYGIERLTAGARVVLCEGEKAADAVMAAGIQAVGHVAGASTVPPDRALAELTGRDVILWPDADRVGRRLMEQIAQRLEQAAIPASLAWVEPPADAPKGWDAADADAAQVIALVAAARPLPLLAREDAEAPVVADYPEPEDMGPAQPSPLHEVSIVEDVARPGRITTVAAVEGTGKSFTVSGELAVRVAVAGGDVAGTWPVERQGPVVVLSEMHRDDDIARLDTVCGALGIARSALGGRFYRLDLYTAAHGTPPLVDAAWRAWFTGWLRERQIVLAIFDTATTAAQIDPWGKAIQGVYAGLRMILADVPALAVVLLVHLKKPAAGRGHERGLEDVLGEWGRFNDVTLLMERDGDTAVKLTLRKRVRRERRIVATKRDGLLVEPVDVEGGAAPKVPPAAVVAAIQTTPGLTFAELAAAIGVTRNTAKQYVRNLPGGAVEERPGARRNEPIRLYAAALLPINALTTTVSVSTVVNERPDNGPDKAAGRSLSVVSGPYREGALTADNPCGPAVDDPEAAGDDDEPPPDWPWPPIEAMA